MIRLSSEGHRKRSKKKDFGKVAHSTASGAIDATPSRAGVLPRLLATGSSWSGATAFLLALAGTLLLREELWRGWGTLLVIVGGMLAVITWGKTTLLPAFPSAARSYALRLDRSHLLPLVGITCAGLLSLGASARYLVYPSATFGLAGWLWLLSMALLLASTLAWPRTSKAELTEATNNIAPAWTGWEVIVFVGLVALAAALRLWDLSGFPRNIQGDETYTGRIAIEAYFGGSGAGPSVFGTLWTTVDLPAMWFALVAASLKLGGVTLWALRLPAALFGAATAIPFYGLVRGTWGRAAAIFGTAVFAFSAVSVHFSRITLNNVVTPFFWTVCFFFLLRGLRSLRPSDWVCAGLAGGASEYGYFATRLLPFILLVFFAYLLIVHRRQAAQYLGHFGLLALGYVVGFGPQLAHYILHPNLYFDRGAGMLVWDHIPTNWQDMQLMWSTLWPIASENLLAVSTHNSQDLLYFAPLLFPVEAALLALGVALLIWQWRHPAAFLVLLSGLGVMLTGATLVFYSPAMPPFLAHWVPAFPALFASLAVPIGAWFSRDISRRFRWLARGALAFGLAVLAWVNITFYFHDYYADANLLTSDLYKPNQRGLELRMEQSRFQATLGPDYIVRTVGQNPVSNNPNTLYLVTGQDWGTIADPQAELPLRDTKGKGLVFIFFPGNEKYEAQVQALYPGGTSSTVRSRGGDLLFFIYVVSPNGR